MANNMMPMMFMMIVIGGAIIAYAKRDEISKMFGGGKSMFKPDNPVRFSNVKDKLTGKYLDPTRAEDLEVTVGDPDTGRLRDTNATMFNKQPVSKFARISYF